LVVFPPFHPFAHIFGWGVYFFASFEDERLGGTLVHANATANASLRFQLSRFSFFIGGLRMFFQPECVHGTPLDTKPTCYTGLRSGAYTIVGDVMGFVMMKHVVSLKKQAAAVAAVADGVCPFLPVGNGMDQPRIRGLLENVFGLFLGDLPTKAIIHDVMTQSTEMEADVQRMITVG